MGRTIKRRKLGIEGDTSSLPYEIISNILLRLPVKSLLRFKCVCKSWLDAISEPEFERSYLNESIKLERQSIFFWDRTTAKSKDLNYVCYDCCDDSMQKLCFPCEKYRKATVNWNCSFNGLVLLWLKKDKLCVLWNPSTRAYKRFSYHIYGDYAPCGFCYDSSMDDYKVLFFRRDFFVVFSFRGQCWTEVKKCPYRFLSDLAIVNGVLHSVAFKIESARAVMPPFLLKQQTSRTHSNNNNNDPPTCMYGDAHNLSHPAATDYSQAPHTYDYLLVYFDMVDEKFKEMPTPNCINQGNKFGDEFGLMVIRGCLSLYYNTIDENYVEVWTMKQYGEHNSWTKFIVIPRWIHTTHIHSLKPLCVTNKGEIVMMFDDVKIFIYNPKINRCTSLGRRMFLDSSLILYVNSFVLPIRTPQGKKKKQL
ncbi:F-box/kelch-repeat protein At3g23880-like [Cornus florida]|uniref:F-box/kelch-repeat protein At3g23880-like n=1 Tax=Cornus florida TaxID=4283 RepID=UPI0028A263B8|nr:F-box/kelch-repeat protein At3g23880-like [Cornus florida]